MNTRRRLLMSQAVQSAPVTTDNYVAGDIAFYDNTDDKIVLVHNEDINTDTYPTDRYTPIGVVVIPNSHDVYGDGSCGVMSLKLMHCETPSQGTTLNAGMCWGLSETNIPTLTDLTEAPIVGSNSDAGDENGTVIGEHEYPYLPSTKFDNIRCSHDTDTWYRLANSSYYSPSPYLTDGSRNPGYYQTTSPSSTSNCLADFDGIGNTDKIIAQRGTKDYTSWKPTSDVEADYPAASCCDMFYTNGTKQGDWYLPACGELGYIMPPFIKINNTITNIIIMYESSVGIDINYQSYLFSSTEDDVTRARGIGLINGGISRLNKFASVSVRAFIRIKPDGTITSRTTTS